MKQTHSQERLLHVGLFPIAIVSLAVVTALMHLILSLRGFLRGQGGPFPLLFLFNCVGYLVLVTALYLPSLRHMQRFTRWILIAYTAITIILWYVIASNHATMFGYVDKLVEGVLLILLLAEDFWLHLRKA